MDATPAEVPVAARAVESVSTRRTLHPVPDQPEVSPRRIALSRALVAAPWCTAAAIVGFVAAGDGWSRVAGAVLGALLAAAAVVDVREHRLPNRLVGGAFVVALGGATTAGDAAVVAAAAGAMVAGGLLFVVHLSRGVGMGDVKAAAAIGMALGPGGWWAAPAAIAAAAAVASVYGAVRGVRRLPLGPSLVLGWAVVSAVVAAGWW